MTPDAYIAHSLPHRLRIRVPSMRGDTTYFLAVTDALSQWPGARSLAANPVTGGVLVHLAPGVAAAQLSEYAQARGLFELGPEPADPPLATAAANGMAEVDRQLRQISAGIDTQSLLFVGFAGMGLYQVLRGQILAPAASLLWYAYQLTKSPASTSAG